MNKKIIGIVIVIALIGVGVWFFGQSGGTSNSFSLGPVDQPDFERSVTVPETFPEEAAVLLQENIEELRELLRADPADQSAWLDLAIAYKTAGDLEGAEHVWRYQVQEQQLNPVSYLNLGNLYHYELQQYEKAEGVYLVAIDKFPTEPMVYIGLYELYRYSYKQDQGLAEQTLKDGIAQRPDSVQLLSTLGSYYAQKGDAENARTYLTQAREQAQQQGQSAVVSDLDTQLEALE